VQIAEITRAETADRARLLRVESYEVTLDLTRGAEVFGSRSMIRFGCTQPGADTATYADLVAETVHEITLNGNPIDPATACADGRITLTGLADSNELIVVADCRYARDGTGLHRAVDPADQQVYTYTKFEPAYARTVYANFEQPDLKASFTISVIVPAGWTVLSNEPVADTMPVGELGAAGGQDSAASRWRFWPTPPLPTYLFAVAAGEYHVVRGTHTTPRGQVIPLGLACRASLAGDLDAEDILDITTTGLDFYPALFQRDYPFAKYDQVFVPEYSVGATENAGCVVFSDRLLFRSRVPEGMYQLRAGVILHEMAHMWFGDLVTMKWWDDLWLNESFAEFAAVYAAAEATKYTDAWATFAGGRKAWGYGQDRLPSTHPVAADVATLTAAIANFDGISYAKGASVLRQLVASIGPDGFFAGIRAYFAGHAWSNATLADWLAALEAGSGTSLAGWAKAWLQTTGPNTLRAEFTVDDAGAFVTFAVLQDPPADSPPADSPPADSPPGGAVSAEHPAPRPHRIAIGLYSLTDDGVLARSDQVQADVDGARTEIPALTGLRQPDLILLNDEDLTYAILRFDERSLRTLTTSIGQLADPLARAVCWTSVADMVSEAELPVPEFVAVVASALPAETSAAAAQNLLEKTWLILHTLADPAYVETANQQLAAVAARLLNAAEAGSDLQLVWAELLSWTATTPEQVTLVAGLLDGGAAPPGLIIGSELRWSLLRLLAAVGRAGDKAIGAELARDKTDAGARNAAACEAAIGDAKHKGAAWQLLTDPAGVPADLLRSVARAFYQPAQAELLAAYTERYFEVLPRLWQASSGHLRVARANALFPVTAADPALVDRIDAFLAAEPRDAGLARVLIERRDQVQRALRSRAL
jgi:aminopeptidase N